VINDKVLIRWLILV